MTSLKKSISGRSRKACYWAICVGLLFCASRIAYVKDSDGVREATVLEIVKRNAPQGNMAMKRVPICYASFDGADPTPAFVARMARHGVTLRKLSQAPDIYQHGCVMTTDYRFEPPNSRADEDADTRYDTFVRISAIQWRFPFKANVHYDSLCAGHFVALKWSRSGWSVVEHIQEGTS